MPSAEGVRPARALALRHALALGLLQGPAELLPVSSSAHTTLIPWLAGWPYAGLSGERRKSFEVAVHAGAGAALALHMRHELRRCAARADRRRALFVSLSLAPAALGGLALGGPIERRLGGPRSIAAGLLGGAAAMALADTRTVDSRGEARAESDAGACDGLALGLAQATALIPGVSRNGAALAAARARGFGRAAAQSLSWQAGLPVIFGASVLQGARLARARFPRERRAELVVGGAAAFLSTGASARLLGPRLREGQPLLPFALYRCGLAALVLARAARLRAQ